MRLHIFDARDPADAGRWAARHASWAAREVFAHPAYVRLFATGRDQPLAAYAETGDGFVLYPFVLRRIDAPHLAHAGRYDLTSAYGYAGAYAEGVDDVAAKRFWLLFDEFCRQRRVVSEFTRWSPLTHGRLPTPAPPGPASTQVVRDLDRTDDQLWREFAHKVRKNVNRARREGVTVEFDHSGAGLADFLRIYHATMDRRRARADYYFTPAFFATLVRELAGQYVLVHARHAGRVVSTELVLVSATTVWSYLGGTEADAFELRPNDLLKVETMRWARDAGRRWYVLGGGYRPDDGIFRYKKAFAPHGLVPFAPGRRVHDEAAYAELVAAHLAEGRSRDPDFQPDPSFFPAYRCPLPDPG